VVTEVAAARGATGRRFAAAGTYAAPIGLAVGTAAVVSAQGGYFPTAWGWAALAFFWAAGMALAFADRIELGRAEIAFLGLLAALVGWIALSTAWSLSVSGTVEEIERVLVYVSGSIAFLLVARRGHTALLLAAILAGLTGVCAYSLATRLFPTTLAVDQFGGYRLATPVGYWNGLGLAAAIAVVLAAGFATEGRRAWARVAAAACLPVLAVTAYFTYSRGAWLALAVGLVVVLAINPRRLWFLTAAFVLAPAPALAVLLASRSPALTRVGSTLAATRHEGHRLAVWILAFSALAAASAFALHVIQERVEVRPRVRRAYAAGLLLIAVGAVAFGLAAGGGPTRIAHHAYDRFLANPVAGSGNLNRRLFQLSSNGRVELWHVAWRQFSHHPLSGTGAGTFEPYWYQHRHSRQTVRDAHSLYVETLGELGLPGLVLLVGVLAVPFAGVSARKRPLVSAALGAYAVLLAHASYDWDWELPALMLAGTWCGLAALVERRNPDTTLNVPMRARFAALAGVGAVGAFAFVALVGNMSSAASANALEARQWTKAAREARRATDWTPWSARAWLRLGKAELAQKRAAAARSAFRKAIDLDPNNYELWQQLIAVTSGREQQAALRRAQELDPQDRLG
jgi:O-antigen ligase/polysaccharide polymerase Wzy-like membrane protein/tetratricopeptide repeat protein